MAAALLSFLVRFLAIVLSSKHRFRLKDPPQTPYPRTEERFPLLCLRSDASVYDRVSENLPDLKCFILRGKSFLSSIRAIKSFSSFMVWVSDPAGWYSSQQDTLFHSPEATLPEVQAILSLGNDGRLAGKSFFVLPSSTLNHFRFQVD